MSGRERYLINWAVSGIASKYVGGPASEFDFIKIDQDEQSDVPLADRIIEACETYSLFSPMRIVWARDIKALSQDDRHELPEADERRLADYVSRLPDTTLLIFSCDQVDNKRVLVKSIKKAGKAYDFGRLDRRELISFVAKRLRAGGKHIAESDMRFLIDETGYFNKESGYDLYALVNDIDKMCALAEGGVISHDIVEQAIIGDEDSFIFDLLDSISARRPERAFELIHNIVGDSEEIDRIVAVIVSQFEIMLSARQLRDEGMNFAAVRSSLVVNEYRLKKLLPYTERFSSAELGRALSRAYELTRSVRTGLMGPRLALELFVTEI